MKESNVYSVLNLHVQVFILKQYIWAIRLMVRVDVANNSWSWLIKLQYHYFKGYTTNESEQR